MSLDKWQQYRRHPIEISEGAVILVRLFTGYNRLEDFWAMDVESADEVAVYDKAAEQFITQIEGHDCIAFHQALIRACQKRVEEWKEQCAATPVQS